MTVCEAIKKAEGFGVEFPGGKPRGDLRRLDRELLTWIVDHREEVVSYALAQEEAEYIRHLWSRLESLYRVVWGDDAWAAVTTTHRLDLIPPFAFLRLLSDPLPKTPPTVASVLEQRNIERRCLS